VIELGWLLVSWKSSRSGSQLNAIELKLLDEIMLNLLDAIELVWILVGWMQWN
jgi:hypothetical protein